MDCNDVICFYLKQYLSEEQFEQCFYDNMSEFEAQLEESIYFELISANFRSKAGVISLGERLREYILRNCPA